MDTDDPMSLLPLVKRRDVGEADDRLPHLRPSHSALAFQALQQAHGSIAAAGAKDGPYGRVGESAAELRQPALVVARQVSVSVEDSRVVLNAVTVGDDGKTGVE